MITRAAARLAQKAAATVTTGWVTATAPSEVIRPEPRSITAKAAPKAAACEMPRVKGEPRGLRRMDCMAAPARARSRAMPKPAMQKSLRPR